MQRAIDSRADGIAVSLIDRTAFDSLTARALAAGIPVIAVAFGHGSATVTGADAVIDHFDALIPALEALA